MAQKESIKKVRLKDWMTETRDTDKGLKVEMKDVIGVNEIFKSILLITC